MKRLFVAVELPKPLRKRIFNELTEKLSNVKKVPEENIHVTLSFTGEVSESEAKQLEKRLAGIEFEKFIVKAGKAGNFREKAFWISAESEELAALAKEVCRKNCSKNEFNGHITIARARPGTDFKEEYSKINGKEINEEFEVEKFALIESTLTENGSIYSKIREFNCREKTKKTAKWIIQN